MQEKILKWTEKVLDVVNDFNGTERTGVALLSMSVLIGILMLAVFIKIASFIV